MSIFVTEPGRPVQNRLPEALRNRQVEDPDELAAIKRARDQSTIAQELGREQQKTRLKARQAIEEYKDGPSDQPESERPYLPAERLVSRLIRRVPASTPLATALETMEKYEIHHLVVDSEGELAGLIDMRWLLRTLCEDYQRNAKAALATFELPAFLTATPDTDAHELARQMLAHRLNAALILDNLNQPRGVITSSDYLRLYAEVRPHEQTI